jgi:phosphoglycolate phosphatase
LIRLAVFDLDGTLVDSRRDLADATNALIEELGGAALSEEVVGSMVGDGAAWLVKRALAAAGFSPETPGSLDRFLHHYDARLLATTRPYPGMIDVLEKLGATRRLAVLTNKPGRATTQVLEGLALLRYFDDVIAGDTPLGRKPDPSGLLELAARADVSPESTILVGDSPIDISTARRAGTHMCVARYGFGYRAAEELQNGEQVIDEPAMLLSIVEDLS